MSIKIDDQCVLLPDRVIDGHSDEARENVAVIVEGQTITGLADRADIPENTELIELAGITLMPGILKTRRD